MRILILFLIPFLIAAAPTRSKSYVSGETIKSNDVTTNEDNIFNYLQSGVDTYADGTIVNNDINNSANIQATKLNLTAISQNIANTGTFTNTGNVTVTGDLAVSSDITATAIVASTSLQASYGGSRPATCSTGQLFVQTADSTGLYICINGTWEENDND